MPCHMTSCRLLPRTASSTNATSTPCKSRRKTSNVLYEVVCLMQKILLARMRCSTEHTNRAACCNNSFLFFSPSPRPRFGLYLQLGDAGYSGKLSRTSARKLHQILQVQRSNRMNAICSASESCAQSLSTMCDISSSNRQSKPDGCIQRNGSATDYPGQH